ncbi:MAG: CD1871A family CXXC motif-containing protein [Saccharofermentanales bacterium]|jgi:hypothetical protein|nr:CD1871A family CXXC motif-containing protein [Bacillota bacterium]
MNIFNKKSTYIIRFTLLVLILFMIGYGIMRSEVLIVLQNAINICLDCIGIG